MEGRVRSGTAGVFPLSFGGQPVGATRGTLLCSRTETLAELNSVDPFDEFGWESCSFHLGNTIFTTTVGPTEKAFPPWKYLFVFCLGYLVSPKIE
jgi:hypothetical protein